jgi:hypothetical protein
MSCNLRDGRIVVALGRQCRVLGLVHAPGTHNQNAFGAQVDGR